MVALPANPPPSNRRLREPGKPLCKPRTLFTALTDEKIDPQEQKDEVGSAAYHPEGVIQQAIRIIKKSVPELLVITDVCLCEYTSHGHCGVISEGDVDNDRTLPLISRTALSHAEAGADMVAPSDMMDGRVKAIREELDREGFPHLPILSYAAKYASAFYGPFREAA